MRERERERERERWEANLMKNKEKNNNYRCSKVQLFTGLEVLKKLVGGLHPKVINFVCFEISP